MTSADFTGGTDAGTGAEAAVLPPVQKGIFTLPDANGNPPSLLGGHCAVCDRHSFPREPHCSRCLGVMDEATLGSRGTVYSLTVVRTKPPLGLPQPYSVGFIDLEDCGLRIFCLLDPDRIGDIRIGSSVRLTIRPLGHDSEGRACLRPCFTPTDAGGPNRENGGGNGP